MTESGEKNKDLIAYCGLYCGCCHGYQGKIPDMARDLRKELRQAKYDKFAAFLSEYSFGKVYKKYEDCYEVLGAMVKFRCKKGCKNGGGNPWCKIRSCCQKKELEGCWLCDEFETCKKLEYLQPVHDDGHLKNLRKLKKQGVNKFLDGKKYW
jgi:hypothetical protein